jgi:flagellar motor switch protein FliN/FliY
MTKNREAEGAEQPFVRAFSSALVKALSGGSGSEWLIAAVPDAESTPDGSEPIRIKLTLDGSLCGEAVLEIRYAAAATLASRFLQHPAPESGAEQSEAILRLIEATVIDFCAAVALEYGVFTIKVSSASEPIPDGANAEQITVCDKDSNRASIAMYLSAPLTEALSNVFQAGAEAAAVETLMRATAGKGTRDPVNLKMVMDVELNVTLRFGQRQLTLREVLELTSGSVVELDRQVEEPVELLLDSKVIARGEAVVIDGNYGLRVTEVCQPIFSQGPH